MKKKMMTASLLVAGSLVLTACSSAAGAAEVAELTAALNSVQAQLATAQETLGIEPAPAPVAVDDADGADSDTVEATPNVDAAAPTTSATAAATPTLGGDGFGGLPALGASLDDVLDLLGDPGSFWEGENSEGQETVSMNWSNMRTGQGIHITMTEGYLTSGSLDTGEIRPLVLEDLFGIHLGMTLAEISAVLGEPQSIHQQSSINHEGVERINQSASWVDNGDWNSGQISVQFNNGVAISFHTNNF